MSSKAANIAIISLGVVTLGFLVLSVFLYVSKENEKIMRFTLEQKLDDVRSRNVDLEKELDDLQVVKKDLELKLLSTEDKARELSKQLEEEIMAKRLAIENATKKDAEVETLKLDLELERANVMDLREKLRIAERQQDKLEQQVMLIRQQNNNLRTQAPKNNFSGDVSLERIVVRPEDVKGNVIVVNREFDFVITDMGERDGVRPGMMLTVKRGNAVLGRLQVEKTYEDMSAAAILSNWTSRAISEGDTVILEN
jgi:vacuolar-type H+-ATPase subunit I/STV1